MISWIKVPFCEGCSRPLDWRNADRRWECPSCGAVASMEEYKEKKE